MSREVTLEQYKWLVVTVALSNVLCWALQEILERKFGMEPIITTNDRLQKLAQNNPNPIQYYEINKRLTKSLDSNGEYRIQVRGSVHFILAVWKVVLFVWCLVVFTGDSEWFMDHFIYMKKDSVNYTPYLHVPASTIGVYSWQLATSRYGKPNWPLSQRFGHPDLWALFGRIYRKILSNLKSKMLYN
eukprot:899752_1